MKLLLRLEELLSFQPVTKLQLEPGRSVNALRSAGRGSAPDLSGTRYGYDRVLLEDETLWSLFTSFCQAFARAEVPEEVSGAVRLGRLTALKKDNGRVRGIVAGSVLRRLTRRAVATQYAEQFMAATAPHQFASQTRAGIEAVAHAWRLLTDRDPDAVVLSLDGVGAFDHVKRAAFFRKLHFEAELRTLLPLVGMLAFLHCTPPRPCLPTQPPRDAPRCRLPAVGQCLQHMQQAAVRNWPSRRRWLCRPLPVSRLRMSSSSGWASASRAVFVAFAVSAVSTRTALNQRGSHVALGDALMPAAADRTALCQSMTTATTMTTTTMSTYMTRDRLVLIEWPRCHRRLPGQEQQAKW